MISAAIHGFILAFGLILPLGVQNVFIFNQGAIQPRWLYVVPVVVTASICDALLISLAVYGVSAVVLGVNWIKVTLLIIGFAFLVYMGYSTWNSKPKTDHEPVKSFTPSKQILFAASVSLLNPHAIMDTIGVIGTSSLSYTGVAKTAFMLSCIFVSCLWFTGLSIIGRVLGKLDSNGSFILLLNKLSALIMWGTALFLMYSIWK